MSEKASIQVFRHSCSSVCIQSKHYSTGWQHPRGVYWLQHARGISTRLIKVVTRTPRRFPDDLCRAFSASKDESLFTKPRDQLEQLRQALHRCQAVILNDFGCGDEFQEVEEIERLVKMIEDWFNEVLMAIMEGKEIEREQRSGCLTHQKETDLVLTWKYTCTTSRTIELLQSNLNSNLVHRVVGKCIVEGIPERSTYLLQRHQQTCDNLEGWQQQCIEPRPRSRSGSFA